MKMQRMVTNQETMVTPSARLQQVILQEHHGTERHGGNQEAHPSDTETRRHSAGTLTSI